MAATYQEAYRNYRSQNFKKVEWQQKYESMCLGVVLVAKDSWGLSEIQIHFCDHRNPPNSKLLLKLEPKGCKTNSSGPNAFIFFILSRLPGILQASTLVSQLCRVDISDIQWSRLGLSENFRCGVSSVSVLANSNCRRVSSSRNMPSSPKNWVPRSIHFIGAETQVIQHSIFEAIWRGIFLCDSACIYDLSWFSLNVVT